MDIDVVVSAHANAPALHHTLLGYRLQSHAPRTVWVAEDGQDPGIAAAVQRHAKYAPFVIEHLTQPHRGFGKWAVVNRAIRAAQAPWLVFTDADCVPRHDLLAQYARRARPDMFLAGGSHVELPQAFHATELTEALLRSQEIFDADFLQRRGVPVPRLRLLPDGPLARLMDTLTPRSAWVGNNAGAWRTDLLRVAGFDESMGYGGADRNLGIRLEHAGVRGRRARHSLVCLHLAHDRPWRDPALVAQNKQWNRALQRCGAVLPRQSLLMAAGTTVAFTPGAGPLMAPAATRSAAVPETGCHAA